MFRRLGACCALLLMTAALALGTAAPALASPAGDGGGDPTPFSPADATAAATAVPTVPSGSTTTIVDGATALAAASTPGADTSVEADLTPEQAVGISVDPGAIGLFKECWANLAWRQWGTWPYQQKITDTTFWCAVYGGHITYRSSSVTTSGTLCGTQWRQSQVIAGGVGFSTMTTRSSAQFSCPTIIPWIVLHPSHYEDIRRSSTGATADVGSG